MDERQSKGVRQRWLGAHRSVEGHGCCLEDYERQGEGGTPTVHFIDCASNLHSYLQPWSKKADEDKKRFEKEKAAYDGGAEQPGCVITLHYCDNFESLQILEFCRTSKPAKKGAAK